MGHCCDDLVVDRMADIEHQNPCDSTMVDENDGTTNTAKSTQPLRPSTKSLTEHLYRFMISVSSGKGCQKRAKAAHFQLFEKDGGSIPQCYHS